MVSDASLSFVPILQSTTSGAAIVRAAHALVMHLLLADA